MVVGCKRSWLRDHECLLVLSLALSRSLNLPCVVYCACVYVCGYICGSRSLELLGDIVWNLRKGKKRMTRREREREGGKILRKVPHSIVSLLLSEMFIGNVAGFIASRVS